MVYREATYEEYIKAKLFAKFRYRFAVYLALGNKKKYAEAVKTEKE